MESEIIADCRLPSADCPIALAPLKVWKPGQAGRECRIFTIGNRKSEIGNESMVREMRLMS
jgi:hypothetical protein